MRIASLPLDPPLGVAPMAGMTDTAFRRLVKRHGGCGLVVSEMVSSEGLVRGIDRTLVYAEYTEEERPVSIQIFGGDPDTMAAAAQIVEGMGANVIDVNMGCPVPKISKHNAGCSLMREPAHAAAVVGAMVKAVKVPVTVKMRAGWNAEQINAPVLAKMVEQAGASALTVHGRTAAQGYSGASDWSLIARVAESVEIPVFGSGDCVEPQDVVDRLAAGPRSGPAGVLVGRGVLRNPWILAQASDLLAGHPARQVTTRERGQFLLDYIDLLLSDREDEAEGFRHAAPPERKAEQRPLSGSDADEHERSPHGRTTKRERWVINKLRALGSWYTKGIEGGSHLRTRINHCGSIAELGEIIDEFFFCENGDSARFQELTLTNTSAGPVFAET